MFLDNLGSDDQMSFAEYIDPFTGELVKKNKNKPLEVVVGKQSKPAKSAPSGAAVNVVQLAGIQCAFRAQAGNSPFCCRCGRCDLPSHLQMVGR